MSAMPRLQMKQMFVNQIKPAAIPAQMVLVIS